MIYNLGALFFIIILKFICKIEVEGREILSAPAPFILASNHISNLDPILLGVIFFPQKLCYFAKQELFSNKLFGFFLRKVGVFPVDRERAGISAMRAALAALKNKPLLIFPQGSRGAEYSSSKSGVGFLCKKSRAAVYAAKIYGTDTILPKGSKAVHRGKIKVVLSRVANINQNDSAQDISRKVIEKIKVL